MSPQSTTTGADQIVVFLFENSGSYDEDPNNSSLESNQDYKVFGTNETFGTQDRDQNSERMYRPFSRQADEVLEGAFDGSWSVDFTLTNSHWLSFLYGLPENDPEDNSNTDLYRYDLSSDNPPESAHIIEETHYPNGDIEQTIFTGCVAQSGDIDVSVEDPVECSLDGAFATEYTYNTGDGDTLPYNGGSGGVAAAAGQPDTQERPLHFGNSELRMGYGGSVDFVGLVQDATIDFEGNVELENELGTRFGVAPSFLNFEPDLSFTRIVSVDSQDEGKVRMYGTSSAATPQESILDTEMDGELYIDDGLSGSTNEFTFDLTGTFPDSYSRNNTGDPQEAIEEEIDRLISSVTVDVEVTSYDPTDAP